MKNHLRVVFAAAVIATAVHAEDTVTLHEHPFLPGNYDMIQNGQRTGAVRQHPFQPGEYEVFDRDGRRVGTIRQEPFREQPDERPEAPTGMPGE
jgi:hypothetical protein